MKKLSTICLVAVLFFGLAATSFIPRADAQTVSVNSLSCTILNYNLGIGTYDSNVAVLQTFLNADGYMSHAPTGYFGGLTFNAVMNFQASQGIMTTGFVGPLTRAAIQNASCTRPVQDPAGVSIYSVSPNAGPVGTTITLTGRGFASNNTIFIAGGAIMNVPVTSSIAIACTTNPSCIPGIQQTLSFTLPSAIGPYCAQGMMCAMYVRLITPGTYPLYVTNSNGTSNTVNFIVTGDTNNSAPLSISGIDAPNSLPISTPATWTVHVASNFTGTLHYTAVWGDEPVYASGSIMAPAPSTIQSSASFTHAYSRTGTYTARFTVSDDYGHSATATSTAVVTPIY